MRSFKNHYSLKAPYTVSYIHKTFKAGRKRWPPFFTRCPVTKNNVVILINLLYLQKVLIYSKACCVPVLDTVLGIRSEVRKKQCLKCISDLVRSRVFLLALAKDNSIFKIGV